MIDAFEPHVHQMLQRLAHGLDQAIDPKGDSKVVVSEAMLRLAVALYLDAQGPTATRARLLSVALALPARANLH